ncbi:hypothetical protein [Deinococcus cellulosilyticus]|uniref:PRC-barrel domain-containing protein n=1 Tax=Deinococcus cellulosilyticus (strain DSM 18568 / NBRC 106333 / KACC 11606 / 5516J-15) TaxID=1223518 RepID=A0A511MZ46_DEIC1|nr:hypothetical protein [Deinococcus cellulosilyticus]GEM45601.1 hypothetical protein DC3_12360 [Deinococcus cellulosilyticus NBRC 106333 = KACC 11606]
MLSLRNLIETGQIRTRTRTLGPIVDVVVHHEQGVVLAYLTRLGPQRPLEAVMLDAVLDHDGVQVTIHSPEDVLPLGKLPRLKLLSEHGQVVGRPWLDPQGRVAGTLEDLTFDEITGKVVYYSIRYLPQGPADERGTSTRRH